MPGKHKSGLLQPFLCLCVLPSCMRSQRSCKLCAELSEVLGVTCHPEKLARRKSRLVFCVFLCNHEQTVLLKKKKKVFLLMEKKKKTSNLGLFCDNDAGRCPFFILSSCLVAYAFPPQPPRVSARDERPEGEPLQRDFQQGSGDAVDRSVSECRVPPPPHPCIPPSGRRRPSRCPARI